MEATARPLRVALDARYLEADPTSTYAGGGVALYTEKLIDHLLAQAPELRLRLVVRPGGPRLRDDPRVEEVPFDAPPQSLQTLGLLARRVKLDDVDLFHSPFNVLPFGLPCPAITTIHDLMWLTNPELCSSFPPRRWVNGAYYGAGIRNGLRRSARVFTVSEASRRAIELWRPELRGKVCVTRNGTDPFFRPVPEAAAAALTADRVARDTPFVFVVGQGSPYKNHPRAVRAFLEAFRDRPEWKLVLVRRFSRVDPEMAGLLASSAARGRVVVLARVEREALRELYARAGIFLFPSLCEGFGLPALEAMACGCPVVTSDRGATREVAGDAAVLVDPEDVPSVARGLRRLADDPALRAECVRRGLERVREFRWEDAAATALAAYREVAAESRNR